MSERYSMQPGFSSFQSKRGNGSPPRSAARNGLEQLKLGRYGLKWFKGFDNSNEKHLQL